MNTRDILIKLHPAMVDFDSSAILLGEKGSPMMYAPHTIQWCSCTDYNDCYCDKGTIVRISHEDCTEEQKRVLKESTYYYNEDVQDERLRRAESGWCE